MTRAEEFLVQSNREQMVSESDTFTPERYGQMFKHLPGFATDILDAGCNTGRGGAIVKRLNPRLHLTGMDCVQERISALDPSVYDHGICGFSTDIPSKDGSFDAILAGEFIEHVLPNQVDATLAEFFRVLRLRGRLVLTTPNPAFFKNKLRNLSVLLEKSHATQHHPDCMRYRLRAIGYSRVRIFGSGRMIRYIGQRVPILPLYGSYLVQADKW